MTIQALELVNFESHKTSLLEFEAGVNIITGLSGHGKSGIVRGFNWVLFNSPAGESMLSYSSDGLCSSGIVFDDNEGMCRTRGQDENGYFLTESEDTFKALRGKVPESVSSIANMDESNVQRQKDFYFMLMDSPGQVAKMFNKVTGLEDMDSSMSIINSMYREKKKQFDSFSTRSFELKERIENISWIIKASSFYDDIESIQEEADDLETKYAALNGILDSVSSVQREIDSCKDVSAIPFINSIFDAEDSYIDLADEFDKLSKLVQSAVELRKQVKSVKVPEKSRIALLETLNDEIEEIQEIIEFISTSLTTIGLYKEEIESALAVENQLKHDHSSALVECGKCPTCGKRV